MGHKEESSSSRGEMELQPPDLKTWLTSITVYEEENSSSSRSRGRTELQLPPDLKASLTSITIDEDTPKPKIQEVPPMLRNIVANQKCYEPLIVSLGPFHHRRPELERMEKLKIAMARQFVADSKKQLEELYGAVAAVAGEARECYAAGATDGLSDVEFTEMMFLDGCFILHFMHIIVTDQVGNMMKSNDVAFVNRDLFLLENQIPFIVLEALMRLRFKDEEKREMLTGFFHDTQSLPPQTNRYLIMFGKMTRSKSAQQGSKVEDVQPKHIHLLDYYRSQLVNGKDANKGQKRGWSSYRSAKELKTVGIHFLPSRTQSYTDVSFQSNLLTSTLRLPPLTVDDAIKSKLLNMVAFETCPDAPDDFGVTSYICLMDDLIDQAEDVMELRSKGVLLNLLGSDQQVADLFNEIGKDLVPNPTAYSEVRKQIEGHYKSKLKVWIAQWLHAHFSSPWTIFGLFVAIFLIGLTVTQTYFTAFPRNPDKAGTPPSVPPRKMRP